MLNENAKKWVEALRSGKFPQSKNKLRTNKGFCCLGVACELAVEAGITSPAVLRGGSWLYEEGSNYLPVSVRKWLGLTDISGNYGNTALSYLNDKGVSFSEIAEIIESEPEGLFVS